MKPNDIKQFGKVTG